MIGKPSHGDVSFCTTCQGMIELFEETAWSAGQSHVLNSWWSHRTHPEDGHDAMFDQQLWDDAKRREHAAGVERWQATHGSTLTLHHVTALGSDYDPEDSRRIECKDIENAHVASSVEPPDWRDPDHLPTYDEVDPELYKRLRHRPVLDFDFPVHVYPSSTPGHAHVVLDAPMHWDDYVELMDVMAKIGLLEPGYVGASKQRGYSSMRLPWVRKEVRVDVPDQLKGQPQPNNPTVEFFS